MSKVSGVAINSPFYRHLVYRDILKNLSSLKEEGVDKNSPFQDLDREEEEVYKVFLLNILAVKEEGIVFYI